MEKIGAISLTRLVMKALAVGMGMASVVLGFLPGVADADTQITLLSVGLVALAVVVLAAEA